MRKTRPFPFIASATGARNCQSTVDSRSRFGVASGRDARVSHDCDSTAKKDATCPFSLELAEGIQIRDSKRTSRTGEVFSLKKKKKGRADARRRNVSSASTITSRNVRRAARGGSQVARAAPKRPFPRGIVPFVTWGCNSGACDPPPRWRTASWVRAGWPGPSPSSVPPFFSALAARETHAAHLLRIRRVSRRSRLADDYQ